MHKCEDTKPSVGSISVTKISGNTYKIGISVVSGTHPLQQVEVRVGDTAIATLPASASGTYTTDYTFTSSAAQTVTANLTDSVFYTASGTKSFSPDANNDNDNDN